MKNAGGAGALAILPAASLAGGGTNSAAESGDAEEELVSLDGEWRFRLDPEGSGEARNWFDLSPDTAQWEAIAVPSTWQIDPQHAGYFGKAWYRKDFFIPERWKGKTIRVEFEAVYHSAKVWLNGEPVGEHLRKGYTAFLINLSEKARIGETNTLTVMADNHFDDRMLPRGESYDWAADGGITRPVSLHITSPAYIERVMIAALPDLEKDQASLELVAVLKNDLSSVMHLELSYTVEEEETGKVALKQPRTRVSLAAGEKKEIRFPVNSMAAPRLWHFDHPHLYSACVDLYEGGRSVHRCRAVFGIKKIGVKDGAFYLNGEKVRLMGVERMAGSNPEYGMAEPGHWIAHDHRDMKELNCVFTRVHWQQDKRVLDFCDRHGILIQLEVPTWGSDTFRGMKEEPDEDIMQNGLEQLTEQIYREYNHPCIFSWGLCNEINGQNPPAYRFAENMLKMAKKLDPHRLCSYASNSLEKSPGKDVSELMDFVEWNEYYESWYPGTVSDMEKNLELIHGAYPGKPIVISEYGWCFCTADRKIDDPRRIEILRSHDEVFRKHDYMGGLIFFCYNDYRTHFGDKGTGPLKQRVHGVVNLYGDKKPSYDVLREESAPVSSFSLAADGTGYILSLETRKYIPAYTLRGYTLRCLAFNADNIPLEEIRIALPELRPGDRFERRISFNVMNAGKIKADILRPTGFSAATVTR